MNEVDKKLNQRNGTDTWWSEACLILIVFLAMCALTTPCWLVWIITEGSLP